MNQFQDKVLFVTGGSSGIGKAVCLDFAAEGAKVIVTARSADRVQSVVDEIQAAGGAALGIAMDVAAKEQVRQAISKAIDAFGRIDILVNNAGAPRDTRFVSMEEEDWDVVMDTILKGAFLVSRYVVPHMIEQKYGRIINMSSRAYLGNPGQANYSAAKAGVIGFTKALAQELGRFEITVNAVAPGLIDTDTIKNLEKFDMIAELQIKNTPIRRIGHVEDVVAAVKFFASDEASYFSGEVLHVSGGRKG
ncbi:MAG: 3-oxoacyl-ACP reductase FabG [Synergistaceae bacterium]|jgi:3-oxoacyl-[acyl-carrier protein] reductase|nr:3-oxoacyl-ACP reductase FabG [Synergistaceae bacterium]